MYPSIAVDSNDRIHVVWAWSEEPAGFGKTCTIQYRVKTETWQPIEDVITSYGRCPSIAVDSQDNIHLVVGGTNVGGYNTDYVKYLKRTSSGWSSPEQVSPQVWAGAVAIAIDQSDNVHVVFHYAPYHEPISGLTYRTRSADGWQSEETVQPLGPHISPASVAVDSSGNVYVVWADRDTQCINIRKRTSTGWQAIEEVHHESGYVQNNPRIAIDSNDHLHVVWQGKHPDSPDYWQLRYKKYTTSWSSVQNLTSASTNQGAPSLIWAWYPVVDNFRTNRPKDGYAFIWNDESYLKFYKSSDLEFEGEIPVVSIGIEPAEVVSPGDSFSVDIQIAAGDYQVDGAQAFLDFNSTYLEVSSVTGGTALPVSMWDPPYFDNSTGRIRYAAGAFSDFPSGTFTLATIQFTVIQEIPAGGTPISFVFDAEAGRMTKVTWAGENFVIEPVVDGIVTPNNPPDQPTNISPADGATGISVTPTLQSSAFSDSDPDGAHQASQWQITTTSGDYSSPVFDSGADSSNLTQITLSSGVLDGNTTYYWRVRHQDNHGAWSDWSSETSFTTFIPVTLKGQVQLQGEAKVAHELTVTLRLVGEETATDYSVTTDAEGNFEIPNLTPGDYDIAVDGPRVLRNVRTNVTLSGPETTVDFGELREGDVDDDGDVDMGDYDLLQTSFGEMTGDEGYNDNANFDRNNIVDITDFSLLRRNFGETSDVW